MFLPKARFRLSAVRSLRSLRSLRFSRFSCALQGPGSAPLRGRDARARSYIPPPLPGLTEAPPRVLKPGKGFARHETVCHSRYEYVRGDVTTNTVEGFFSILKRGLHGVYHNVSQKHLPLYLRAFSFRYNARKMNDGERMTAAIQAANGKRLFYREPVRKAV